MKQVTQKDVARVADVHVTTVSMALRGHESLPPATRTRIRRIADRMGYVSNPVYAALTQRRLVRRNLERPLLAYLVNRPPEMGFWDLHHHRQLLAGATRQANLLGYDLDLLFVDDAHYDSVTLAAHFARSKIVGFIMSVFEPGLAELVLDWDRYAVIKIDSLHIEPAASVVSNDHEKIVRLAFRRLSDLGYRRIGLAIGRADEVANERRFSSGLFLEQSLIPEEMRVRPLLFPFNVHVDEIIDMLARWVRSERVEVVLCNWLNIETMLESGGFKVPHEVACACLCLGDAGDRLAGVVVHNSTVGGQAVSALSRQIRAEGRADPGHPTVTFVDVDWNDGATAPVRGGIWQ